MPVNIKKFSLFKNLSDAALKDISADFSETSLGIAETLFERGSEDGKTYFLVQGEIDLLYEDGNHTNISAISSDARNPISNVEPRRARATAETGDTIVISIDTETLNRKLAIYDSAFASAAGTSQTRKSTPPAGHVNASSNEPPDGLQTVSSTKKPTPLQTKSSPAPSGNMSEWIFQLMSREPFMSLPTESIDSLLAELVDMPVKAGQIIIKEGDKADCYYMLIEGEARVSMKKGQFEMEVAVLSSGDIFGEQALLNDAPRNATVSMLSDGLLVKLSGKRFKELLAQPLVRYLPPLEAIIKNKKQGMQLVDVRLPQDYSQRHLKGSINIPHHQVRKHLDKLDKAKPYIFYCNTGVHSGTAAFIAREKGYDVWVMQYGLNGLDSLQQEKKNAG